MAANDRDGWFAIHMTEAGQPPKLVGWVYSPGFVLAGFRNAGETLAFAVAKTLTEAAAGTGVDAEATYQYAGARGSGFGGHMGA